MGVTKLGRYDLVGVLGSGAMGFVYEGFDPNLKRRVAIKTIKVDSLSKAQAEDYELRFRTESHSAARLQHPNIVSVYDSDRHDGVAFLVMEYVDGQDLKQHLDAGTVYSLKQTRAMVEALLAALEYAHGQGIVHRDVKPANLLITKHGHIKLTDFGVARIQNSGEATRTQGSIVGTLKYMSPEQIQGLPIDARTDLFSVGVVLYQLLTGIRPFDAETDFAVIQKIVSQTPKSVTSLNTTLPSAIDVVVARSLSKSRDDRYATAAEFSLALSDACFNADALNAVPTIQFSPRPKSSDPATGSDSNDPALRLPFKPLNDTSTEALSDAPAVAQEIELVCWKKIENQNDIDQLDIFLNRFPSGIYADLAQRRRRQLSNQVGANSLSGGALFASPFDGQVEPPSSAGDRASISHEDSALQQPFSKVMRLRNEQTMLIKTFGASMFSIKGQPSAADAPVSDGASPANSREETMSQPRKLLVARRFYYGLAAVLTSVTLISAAVFGLRPDDKPLLSKVSRGTAQVVSNLYPATRNSQPGDSAAAASIPERPKIARHRQLCENRVMLAFQICMSEQCQKPALFNHAACVERRTLERQRREQEQLR